MSRLSIPTPLLETFNGIFVYLTREKEELLQDQTTQDCTVGDPLVRKWSGQILRHNEEIKKAGETAL